MSQAILTIIEVVSFVVIGIILAVVANTMAMSVRERTNEYAVFKTLGFGTGTVVLLVMGESLVITLTGGVLGLGMTFPAATAFQAQVDQFFPVFAVSQETLVLQMICSLAVGLLAGIVPALSAARTPIAVALRRID
jgi:putative ABC transport system permease protein